jgi:hypothetical protein
MIKIGIAIVHSAAAVLFWASALFPRKHSAVPNLLSKRHNLYNCKDAYVI